MITSSKTDEVIEQNKPTRNVEAVNVHSFPRVGYSVAKKMKKEDRRNIIAPTTRNSLKMRGSSAENFSTAMLSDANVHGRAALLIGSTRLPLTRFPI
jgi:hypothetical protein